MANVFRMKRRAAGGAAGAPAALKTTEIAYNEQDDTWYVGYGDDGNGNATSIRSFAGAGTFAKLNAPAFTGVPTAPTAAPGTNTTQIATTAFVQAAVGAAGGGDMLKSVYDTTDNGIVDNAEKLNNQAASFYLDRANHTGAQAIATITGLQTALDAKGPLASPALTGVPTAPTAAPGTNTTQISTTAFVQAAIAALINSAPGALDTLNELAASLGNDPNFATTITNALTGKADLTLSNLSNLVTARTNLGLGSMAVQNASAVAITGGTIDGITLDGGTF
jgi:hypothetical protein